MNLIGIVVANAVGGMIVGGIGAYVADSSGTHPVLKGALAAGAVNALIGTAVAAGYESAWLEQSSTVHGLGEPNWL